MMKFLCISEQPMTHMYEWLRDSEVANPHNNNRHRFIPELHSRCNVSQPKAKAKPKAKMQITVSGVALQPNAPETDATSNINQAVGMRLMSSDAAADLHKRANGDSTVLARIPIFEMHHNHEFGNRHWRYGWQHQTSRTLQIVQCSHLLEMICFMAEFQLWRTILVQPFDQVHFGTVN